MSMQRYYCHNCNDWQESKRIDRFDYDGSSWECVVCGDDILCDECGSLWTLDHEEIHG